MQKTIGVTLGGKSFEIEALPIRQSKAWRDKLAMPFGILSAALTTAGTVEVNQLSDIAGLVRDMSGVLLGSIDILMDLVFDYSPSLALEREWIENNAYDEELLEAFAAILRMAFPFGVLSAVVTGRTVNKTLSNSHSQNGTSGLPVSGPPSRTSTGLPTAT